MQGTLDLRSPFIVQWNSDGSDPPHIIWKVVRICGWLVSRSVRWPVGWYLVRFSGWLVVSQSVSQSASQPVSQSVSQSVS